ncbi:sodium-dependent nutrient amino acid transporter 1 isoform X2 [Condylostylus longicornis]|nr:sodium-dependent nutrient amino acid transporter 1 isoform X2 [Condylostylus longicornis]XP_055378589.1 sodium-dependent nutrient amino acid transporter 1 isoform X2 [Condylostylus longicornis]XP_055378590.1 sodium-dependent nutrient amino acid transporter 1 isoform X2 [Condylostylus longicornis]XP_055378591.1 sodium-dependent nutrient amino acid transporter 1 isoform X2 [Condylostylus longicornis]XP_055378593.1 sodium-dependent nutrient amino acid transporter 1 isoform X2 [Condylostylus lon
MSFADRSEIIAGNKFSPTKFNRNASTQHHHDIKLTRTSSKNITVEEKFKSRISNDSVLEQHLRAHQEKLQKQLEKRQQQQQSKPITSHENDNHHLDYHINQLNHHINQNRRKNEGEYDDDNTTDIGLNLNNNNQQILEETMGTLNKSSKTSSGNNHNSSNSPNSINNNYQYQNDNQIFTITSINNNNNSNNDSNSNNNKITSSHINRTHSITNGKTSSSINHQNNQQIFHQPLQATSSAASNTQSTINDTTTTTATTHVLDNNNYSNNGESTINNFHHHHLNHHHHNYANTTTTNKSSNGSIDKAGSTAKLIPVADDQPSTQSKCSIFRNLVLCICLNVTYGNIVRFPRELDRHGLAFLVPYLLLLFLVGFPLILLEIAVGQFLGQGAANTWRSSPILKGACIVSRFASWLATVWISLQAVMAGLYIGMLVFKSIPFSNCVEKLKIFEGESYKVLALDGQHCIKKTFLTPVWNDPFYYGLLIFFLILLWIITMFCTHSAKIYRRTTFFFGLIGFGLLIALTSWEVKKSLDINYFPELWSFNEKLLSSCVLWFNALVQVIYSTNIGFGILPVMTGKFLYKGDAVRTSIIYLCFNLLINAIAVTLYMVQYDNEYTKESTNEIPELKPLTAIYDKLLDYYANADSNPNDMMITKISGCLIFALIIISSIITISTAIYTSSRLVPKHPNYVMSLLGLSVAIAALVCPEFKIIRILDSRIVGTLVISSLIFDLIATVWVYGKKNIYTDLEFSIGRPIFKGWLYLWILAPVLPTAILVWWCVGDDQNDVLFLYLPRWAPIAFVLVIILLMAAIEIFRQVDYNFFGMICEAAKPAKEWGPADPLARHAWKQWRSVCQDTGRKDFTLRRRGTRDYTHSIKKGQYSTRDNNAKLGTPTSNWKSVSTPGSNSPNYSGSVFGDSAIEEDMSVDKYSGVNHNYSNSYQHNDTKLTSSRYPSNRSRKMSNDKQRNHHNNHHTPYPPSILQQLSAEKQQKQLQSSPHNLEHKEILYIRRLSNDETIPANHSTRIEITPSSEAITYAATRNPMARTPSNVSTMQHYKISLNPSSKNNREPISSGIFVGGTGGCSSNNAINIGDHKNTNPDFDHICWRKFSVNSEEYSTEL